MKKILIGVAVIAAACGSPKEETANGPGIFLSGSVGFPQEGALILVEKYAGNQPEVVDTIELNDDNTYKEFVSVETPGYYRLNFYGMQMMNVILAEDDMVVNVDGNSRQGFAEIKGSSDHDLINTIRGIQQEMQSSEKAQTLGKEFNEASQSGNTIRAEEIRQEYMTYIEGVNDQIALVVKNSKPSIASIELLRSGNVLNPDKYFDLFESISNQLGAKYPGNEIVDSFVEMVESMKKLAIGQVAPEIELPNPDGELVKLSSLRGNYVLVDFWAKWCRPCRAENPNVVKAFKKFNPKGFEVFGVSLDKTKEEWVQAIEEDGLTWTHVSDLKFWQSEAAKLYGVTSIPFSLLLDPDGKIVAKNLRGPLLDEKLAEIYGD